MKNLLRCLPCVLFAALFCSCSESPAEQALDRLDEVIATKNIYEQIHRQRVDSLRGVLDRAGSDTLRWRAGIKLFDSYINYNIDSAAHYVTLMKEYAARTGSRFMQFISEVDEVAVLISRSDPEVALRRMREMDTVGIDKTMRANYYTRLMSIYVRLAAVGEPSKRQAYADTLFAVRHERIGFDGHGRTTRTRMHALELSSLGHYRQAIDMLTPLYESSQSERTHATVAYDLATIHQQAGDDQEAIYWLACASVHDLRTPVKEYLSLYDLAMMMLEKKDMERAGRYIQCTLEDVLSCNYNTRILHSGKAGLIINEAVVYHINSRSRILTVMVVIFLALLTVIVLLLLRMLHQHRRLQHTNRLISRVNDLLHERNEQIRVVNDRLLDANKIKDSYVFRYMDLSAQYIGRVDSYRYELRQTAKSGGSDALLRKLRAPSDVDREYRDFYHIFDETFLGIFPDFVEQVNELLEESMRFTPAPGQERTLSTELRMLAVIRLGITDSGRIASFLNCAAATIYTYRTKLRNSALCPRGEFESRIQQIGL